MRVCRFLLLLLFHVTFMGVYARETPADSDAITNTSKQPLALESLSELTEKAIITDEQATVLRVFLEMGGLLTSWEELALLPGWDVHTATCVRTRFTLPITPINAVERKSESIFRVKGTRSARAKKQKNITRRQHGSFVFTPIYIKQEKELQLNDWQLALKAKMEESGNISVGLLADKDKKEPLALAYKRFFVLWENEKSTDTLRKVIIGQYSLKSSQGMVVARSSSQAQKLASYFAKPRGWLAKTESKSRNAGFRGIGIELAQGVTQAVVYTAFNTCYATVRHPTKSNRDSVPYPNYIKSLPVSNTFFADEEMQKEKSQQQEKLLGMVFNKQLGEQGNIGLQLLTYQYTLPYLYQGNFLTRDYNGSLFGAYRQGFHELRGEIGGSSTGIGFSMGHKIHLGPYNHFLWIAQYYSADFRAPYGSGTEKCKGNNEQELTLNVRQSHGKSTFVHTGDYYQPLDKLPILTYELTHTYDFTAQHQFAQEWKWSSKEPTWFPQKGKLSYTYQPSARVESKTTVTLPHPAQICFEEVDMTLKQKIHYKRGPWQLSLQGTLFPVLATNKASDFLVSWREVQNFNRSIQSRSRKWDMRFSVAYINLQGWVCEIESVLKKNPKGAWELKPVFKVQWVFEL